MLKMNNREMVKLMEDNNIVEKMFKKIEVNFSNNDLEKTKMVEILSCFYDCDMSDYIEVENSHLLVVVGKNKFGERIVYNFKLIKNYINVDYLNNEVIEFCPLQRIYFGFKKDIEINKHNYVDSFNAYGYDSEYIYVNDVVIELN